MSYVNDQGHRSKIKVKGSVTYVHLMYVYSDHKETLEILVIFMSSALVKLNVKGQGQRDM